MAKLLFIEESDIIYLEFMEKIAPPKNSALFPEKFEF
jgi:hypothetical protein